VDHGPRSGARQNLGNGLRGTPDDALDDFHNAPLGIALDDLTHQEPWFCQQARPTPPPGADAGTPAETR
jgi:hypothetical protein